MIMFWSLGQERIGVEFVEVTVIHAYWKNQLTKKITEGMVSLICQCLAAAVAFNYNCFELTSVHGMSFRPILRKERKENQ